MIFLSLSLFNPLTPVLPVTARDEPQEVDG